MLTAWLLGRIDTTNALFACLSLADLRIRRGIGSYLYQLIIGSTWFEPANSSFVVSMRPRRCAVNIYPIPFNRVVISNNSCPRVWCLCSIPGLAWDSGVRGTPITSRLTLSPFHIPRRRSSFLSISTTTSTTPRPISSLVMTS